MTLDTEYGMLGASTLYEIARMNFSLPNQPHLIFQSSAVPSHMYSLMKVYFLLNLKY